MITKTISTIILLTISVLSFGQFEKYNSFEKLDSLSKIYFQNNDLDSAILAVEFALDKYPAYDEKATFILGFLYVRGGYDSKALTNWNYGHTKGYFYGLNSRQYLNHFKDNVDFKKIAGTDKNIGDRLDSISHIVYEVSFPKSYSKANKYPLIFIFHGSGRNLQKAKQTWTSETMSNEFITVYLQSYIHTSPYDYKWIMGDDKTAFELKEIYQEVVKKNSIDNNKIILAGMSAGGMVAIDYGFNNILTGSHFLFNCPVIPEINSNLINDFVIKNKEIVIITGENDFALNKQKELVEMIKGKEGQAEIKIIAGMGHQFSNDFSSLLYEYLKNMIE